MVLVSMLETYLHLLRHSFWGSIMLVVPPIVAHLYVFAAYMHPLHPLLDCP
jgi:hypothetical protein